MLLNAITIFLTYRCNTLIRLWKPAYGFRLTSFISVWITSLLCGYYSAMHQKINFNSLTFSYIFQALIFQSHFYFYSRLIELSGEVEKNPGPNSEPDEGFCHWNLNSIAAHNFSKTQSLIAYNCIDHFDIICLSETYLNSDISSNNENLFIPGCRFIRSDHPSNDKWGGVCVYFKSSLSIQILTISMLHECINLEIRIDDKLYTLICLYRPPSQNMKKFDTFVKNLDVNLEPIFTKNPYNCSYWWL